MGVHKNRLWRSYTRLERNKRPDPMWEPGWRYTSSCTACGTTWWAHSTPRRWCERCGALCIVTETLELEPETP